VTLHLTSKASGGLTAKDLDMAATIDRLVGEGGA
jgi:pterin-4a-carbinolamine dehydratase